MYRESITLNEIGFKFLFFGYFQGRNLNMALKPEDYTITVENNPCPVKELTSSYLRCDLTETIHNHNLFEEKAVLTITVRL